MTRITSVVSVVPTLAPARLSDLIREQPIDIQRHIHTAVIRAVNNGQLRGIKLAEQIRLPHCRDANRMINKSDIGFLAIDVPNVQKFILQIIQKHTVKNHEIGGKRVSFEKFLELNYNEFEEQLRYQRAENERMRSYRR